MTRATPLITIALVASAASVSAAEPRERLAFLVGDATIAGRETSVRDAASASVTSVRRAGAREEGQ